MKIVECMGNIAVSCAETACQFNIGQFFIRQLDRGIGIVERTAQWSLPSNEIIAEENGKSFKNMELVRPLPWILFLPGLVILRGFRFTWNVGAFFLGYDAIHPGDIVESLQRLRRRLRTIRMNGIRRMRKIRPTNSRTPALVEKSTTESTTMTQQCETKRKYSQVSSDDPLSEEESETDGMTLDAKLKHYEDMNSADDTDFSSPNCTAETEDLEISDGEKESFEEDEVKLLVAEAKESLNMIHMESKPEMSEARISPVLDENLLLLNITTKNGNGNCAAKNLDDIQNYHSPCKSIEDTDTAFYSPISSKSSSPERDLASDIAVGIVHESTNAGFDASKCSTIITKVETKSDHNQNYEDKTEKKNEAQIESPGAKGKQQRDNNKGKRSTHGNRKKKL